MVQEVRSISPAQAECPEIFLYCTAFGLRTELHCFQSYTMLRCCVTPMLFSGSAGLDPKLVDMFTQHWNPRINWSCSNNGDVAPWGCSKNGDVKNDFIVFDVVARTGTTKARSLGRRSLIYALVPNRYFVVLFRIDLY
jgi:hypothetical protein